MDLLSTKITSTIATSTVSINSDSKKLRYKIACYILHTVLLVIILLSIITNIFYHYAKHRSKQKDINTNNIKICTNNIKMENNEFKDSFY